MLSIGTRLRPTAQHRTSRICWLKHPIRVLLLLANDLRFGANNLRFGAKMRRFVTAYEFLPPVAHRATAGRADHHIVLAAGPLFAVEAEHLAVEHPMIC